MFVSSHRLIHYWKAYIILQSAHLLQRLNHVLAVEGQLHDLQGVAVEAVLVEIEDRNLLVLQGAPALGLVGALADARVGLDAEKLDQKLGVHKKLASGFVGLHLDLVGFNRLVLLEVPDGRCCR